jgi:hypothetical protein
VPQYAQLRIDWNRRDFKMLRGLEGDSPHLPFGDALAFVAQDEGPDVERYAVVYWSDVEQLCHYDITELLDECLVHEEQGLEEHLEKALPVLSSEDYLYLLEKLADLHIENARLALEMRPPTAAERISLLEGQAYRTPQLLVEVLRSEAPDTPLSSWLDQDRAAELLQHRSAEVRLLAQGLWARLETGHGGPERSAAEPHTHVPAPPAPVAAAQPVPARSR